MADRDVTEGDRAETSVTDREPNRARSFAESIAVVQFRSDPDRLQSLLLPPPLEPVGDGDTGFALIGDAVYSGRGGGTPPGPIEAGGFSEAAVGMPCRYGGDRYVVNPIQFLDRPTDSFRAGTTRGLARITKTKWHASCEGRREIRPGHSVAGSGRHGTDELFDLSMEIEEEVTRDHLDEWVFAFLHYRRVSDPLAGADTTTLANDVTVIEVPSISVDSIWQGPASLTFGGWRRGLLAGLAESVVGGFHITMEYDYAGERVLAPVEDWGDHIE